MRLWSTVVIHDATRPRRQSARYVSVLTATRRTLVNVPPDVGVEREELLVRPAERDRRHVARGRRDAVLAVDEQGMQALRLGQQRVRLDRRAVPALSLEAVALGADADPLVPAEISRRSRGEPRPVVAQGLREDPRLHLCVEDTAELAAAPSVDPHLISLEPRVILPARDRVELAAEGRDPPAVNDVVRVDVDADDAMDGNVHLVDRDRARRIGELPVELVRVDPDHERAALCLRLGDVLDPRQLVEDEARDRREDQHRDRRPDQLEARRAMDLRAFGIAPAPAAAVTDDEPDERALG